MELEKDRLDRGLERYSLNNSRFWITTEKTGSHILVDGDGNVVAGAGGKLKGKKFVKITRKSKDVDKEQKDSVSNMLELAYKKGARSAESFSAELIMQLSRSPSKQKSLLSYFDINEKDPEAKQKIKQKIREEFSNQRNLKKRREIEYKKQKSEAFLKDIERMAEFQEKQMIGENASPIKVYRAPR